MQKPAIRDQGECLNHQQRLGWLFKIGQELACRVDQVGAGCKRALAAQFLYVLHTCIGKTKTSMSVNTFSSSNWPHVTYWNERYPVAACGNRKLFGKKRLWNSNFSLVSFFFYFNVVSLYFWLTPYLYVNNMFTWTQQWDWDQSVLKILKLLGINYFDQTEAQIL